MKKIKIDELTKGRLLAKNVLWNLLGQGVPIIIAVATIPLIIDGMGTDRFGILLLAWMLMGYFGLFDMGFSRALTKLIAEKLGANNLKEIPSLIWSAILFMLILGLIGAIFLGLSSKWLIDYVLNIPEELQRETLSAFYLLSVSIPIVIVTAGFTGILEALQRFSLLNAVRIPMGLFSYIGPLLVLPFSSSLYYVVAVLIIGRIFFLIVLIVLCLYSFPEMRSGLKMGTTQIMSLVRFGSWMTISNIVGPMMVRMDRFLIGAIATVAAIAYYATPFEVVTKLLFIPVAVVGVLFPAFATSYVQDQNHMSLLFFKGVKYIYIVLFPITLLIVALSYEGLDLWLGSEFSTNSTYVLQLLAIGIFINSLAHVPVVLIMGVGRPDIIAKIHMIELPIYLILTYLMIVSYGINGAALTWLLRVSADALVLFIFAEKFMAGVKFITRGILFIASACMVFLIAMIRMDIFLKTCFLSISMVAFLIAVWFVILNSDERAFAKHFLMKS